MKILYGVQGTGNGHITRARALAPALASQGIEVDYLFSGRPVDQFFDMDVFGNFKVQKGLTMVAEQGRIHGLKTVTHSSPVKFLNDTVKLDTKDYDLILSDFEPITAWAGRFSKTPVLGLGHQYAFHHPIPQHYGGLHHKLIMKYFAPAPVSLGFHWYHFGAPILPPIAPVAADKKAEDSRRIVVYLPFEDCQAIRKLLEPFSTYQFKVFHPQAIPEKQGHIQWFKTSRATFHQELAKCNGVICNAGFELASEVLQLGRKLLVKPVSGQSEQLSNALALRVTGLGYSMNTLDRGAVENWLNQGRALQVYYPDVSGEVARWIAAGHFKDRKNIEWLARRLWRQTRFPSRPLFSPDEILTEIEVSQ